MLEERKESLLVIDTPGKRKLSENESTVGSTEESEASDIDNEVVTPKQSRQSTPDSAHAKVKTMPAHM